MLRRLKSLLLENKSARQTIVKNAFWLSMSQLGGRGIRAAAIIYAARLLGTAEYGVFSYALGLAGFFTLFADIGINSVLTRNVAQRPSEAREFFATAFWMKVILLTLTALAIVFVAPSFSNVEGAAAIIPLVALIVIFDNLKDFWNAYFRAHEKMEREAFVTLFTNVAIAVLCVAALTYAPTARSVTYAYVGSVLLGTLAGIALLRDEFVRVITHFKKEFVREIAAAAWATAIIGLLGSFMLSLDIVILGWLTNASAVGLYAAAQRIIQVLYLIPSVIASSIFPALSRAAAVHDHDAEKNLMERSLAVLFAVALPLTVGGVVLGAQGMQFIFGTDYVPATLTFQILMATLLFVFPGTLVGNFILAHHKQKEVAVWVGLAALMNAVLDYALIIPFGIAGCAAATLIVAVGFNYIMTHFAQREVPFRVLAHIKTPLVAALVMGAIAYGLSALGLHVATVVALAGIAYVCMLVVLKDPVVNEARTLLRRVSA